MKIIFKIARAELRTLFYSPIAWLVIVVFFVVTGTHFSSELRELAKTQEISMEHSPSFSGFHNGLTTMVFKNSVGQILIYLHLFLPLLTMGAISRDQNSGALKLLYSSPIRIRELVMGKYLGLVAVNFCLLLSVALLLFTGSISILNADSGVYMSMFLGFFLLSNTYIAIGLFISTLSSYQIVTGIITYVVFFMLNIVGLVGQNYDFVRDLTYFMSLSGRVDQMIAGLISSRNVLYYILIISLFLGFALIKLKSLQESKSWKVHFSRYLVFAAVILLLGYASSRPGSVVYFDATENKKNTIDIITQQVLKELDGSPLTVTLYTNLLDGKVLNGLPSARNAYLWNYWEKFLRFYPNIHFKYEYYYKLDDNNTIMRQTYPNKSVQEMAALRAKSMGLNLKHFKPAEEIEKVVDLSHEPSTLLMELEYKNKKAFLRTYEDPVWPTQSNVSSTIRRLVRNSTPKVLFSSGHFERSPWKFGEREYAAHTNYKGISDALINNGVDLDTISIKTKSIHPETDVLVVADPKSPFDAIEQERVANFLDNGGNALFYAEPGKEDILNPILNKIGVNIEKGVLINLKSQQTPEDASTTLNPLGHTMAREERMQYYMVDTIWKATGLFVGTSELTYADSAGFVVEPIVEFKGNNFVWLEKGYKGLDSALATYSVEEDVRKEQYVIALRLTRNINGKEQRIVVSGDADFMSRKYYSGLDIKVGFYSWLLYNEYPVYINYHVNRDVLLTISRKTANVIWASYVYVIPGGLLLTGLLILIRRSRK